MRQTRIRLLIITSILMALGAVMIYSSSAMYAYDTHNDSSYFLKRHVIFLIVGLFISVFLLSFDYINLRRLIKPFLLVSLLLLVLVFVPGIGRSAGGAHRWIRLGFINFQPSEIAKMAMIFYAADVLSRKQSDIKNFVYGFLPLIIVLGVCLALIILEPDLGTAVTIGVLILIMAFVASVRLKHLLLLFLSSMPAMALLVFIKPYRVRRILAFMNPWAQPREAGFQIIQSFIALGSGGLFGVGLGHSIQKLFYLPQAHTDFIFAIIGEELGLLGTMAVLILFTMFILLGVKIAYRARDLFGQFLAFGLVSMIALQVIVNIGSVTGSIPTKGLPLPFISYGGTSLIFSMVSVSLLLNIARYRR